MIGVAKIGRPLRHSVEAQQQPLRLELEDIELPPQIDSQCVDVKRIVVIGWECPQRRLNSHGGKRREHGVIGCGRRRRAILRVERRGEDARASLAHHLLDGRGDPRIAVAHCIMNADVRKPFAKRLGLAMCDHPERRPLVGPYLIIGFGRPPRAGPEDDPVQDRLPGDGRNLDDSGIAEELGQIAPDRSYLRRVGCSEIDQQHADARLADGPISHHAAMGSNGSDRIRLPVAE
jgi:hypothetical protein